MRLYAKIMAAMLINIAAFFPVIAQDASTLPTSGTALQDTIAPAQDTTLAQQDTAVSSNPVLAKYNVNTAFEPGEELIYDLKYGIIKGGELKINVYLEPVG